ncbi:MAG TPA: hypothetical protein PKC67_08725 [Kiritimatiellia bacterium]|nr:hypothetical protein [Kiritimatiellia bacterium]HMP34422.1 hypothetical protein [Kiritimatiellia bacterium]
MVELKKREQWAWWVAGTSVLLTVLSIAGYVILSAAFTLITGSSLSQPFIALLASGQQALAWSGWCCLLVWWLLGRWSRRGSWVASNRFTWLICLAGGAAALIVQAVLFENVPHITDATSHLFQARILGSGRLAVPNPPCVEAFFQHNVVIGKSGWWHTKYFPGQALWLSPWVALGLTWLAMPLAWTLCLRALHAVARCFVPAREAGLAISLLAFSPLGLLVSASFMSHTTFLLFMAGGCALLLASMDRPEKAPRRLGLIAAGTLVGLAAITRPQDLVPFGVVLVFAAVVAPAAARGSLFRSIPWAGAGVLLPLAFLLFWNQRLYGGWLSSGYHFGESISLTPIIRDAMGFSEFHTPARALHSSLLTLYRMDGAMLGWPTALPFCLVPFMRRRWDLLDVACAGWAATTVGLYALFHYQGFELEARYYLPALPPLALLATRGILRLADGAGERSGSTRRLAAWLAGLYTFAALHYWPIYIAPKYGDRYEQVGRDYHAQAQAWQDQQGGVPLLVLIEDSAEKDFHYSAGFIFNDPDLQASIVYARLIPDQLACLKQAFPERQVVRITPEGALVPME